MQLLARRPHFRRELEVKLGRRGFAEEEIRHACERLDREGFLDDGDCARQLAAGPFRRKGFGPARVRAELGRRGAPEAAIAEVLEASFGDGERERALEVARRWLGRNRRGRERLARHLDRKGYGAATIVDVLHECGVEESETALRTGE